MTRYRTVWSIGAVVLGALGLWAAVEILTLSGAVTIMLLAAAVGVSVALVPLAEGATRPWRRALEVGALSGVVVVAAAGLMGMFGVIGAALAVAMTVLSPAVLRAARRWYLRIGGRPGEGAPPARTDRRWDDDVTAPSYRADTLVRAEREPPFLEQSWMVVEPSLLDDADLCLAWRKTYVALQKVWAPVWRLRIAQRRAQILDELERRNAGGFAAWLAAGARAAGDPSRFIVTASRPKDRGDHR
jgi:hypothetical protein